MKPGKYFEPSLLGSGFCSLSEETRETALKDSSLLSISRSPMEILADRETTTDITSSVKSEGAIVNANDVPLKNQPTQCVVEYLEVSTHEFSSDFKVIQDYAQLSKIVQEEKGKSYNGDVSGAGFFSSLISAGVSGGYSNKTSFLNSFSENNLGQIVLVHIRFVNHPNIIKTPIMKDSALKLLTESKDQLESYNRFRIKYGDCFIRGVITGGEYFAAIQSLSSSQEETSEFAKEIEWGLRFQLGLADPSNTFGFGVNLGTEHTSNESSQEVKQASNSSYQITTYQTGAGLGYPMTLDMLAKDIINFCTRNASSPTQVFSAIYSDYDSIISDQQVNELIKNDSFEQIRSALTKLNHRIYENGKIIQDARHSTDAKKVDANYLRQLIDQYDNMVEARRKVIFDPSLIDDEDWKKKMLELCTDTIQTQNSDA